MPAKGPVIPGAHWSRISSRSLSRKASSPKVFTFQNRAWLPPAAMALSPTGPPSAWNRVTVMLSRLPPLQLYRSKTRTAHRALGEEKSLRSSRVAETLPPYVRPAEPTLEDAYLYLISREAVQ